jgi:lipopolysaccharide export LptBFGC system permease protein LptF
MPEEIEVDTDNLRESIDREIERQSGGLLRTIALTTALFAALAAIASLEAGGTVNEALALKTEATQLQAQASDQWSYYQAKGLKAAVAGAQNNIWIALDKPPPADLATSAQRYLDDQKSSREKAEALEHERDAKTAEADALMHRHHYFADAVALLQVAIALGAIAALTRRRAAWIGSAILGVIGCGLFGFAFYA